MISCLETFKPAFKRTYTMASPHLDKKIATLYIKVNPCNSNFSFLPDITIIRHTSYKEVQKAQVVVKV